MRGGAYDSKKGDVGCWGEGAGVDHVVDGDGGEDYGGEEGEGEDASESEVDAGDGARGNVELCHC